MSDSDIRSAANEIRQAASIMSEAAEKMRQVLRDYDYTITCHQRFMSGWLENLQETLRELLPSEENPLMVKMLEEKPEEASADSGKTTSTYSSDRPTMRVPFNGEELSD